MGSILFQIFMHLS